MGNKYPQINTAGGAQRDDPQKNIPHPHEQHVVLTLTKVLFFPEVLVIAEVGYDGSPPGGEFAKGSHSLCRIVLQSIGLVIPEFLTLGHQGQSPTKA